MNVKSHLLGQMRFLYTNPRDKVIEERLNYLTVAVMKANVQIGKISDLKKARHSALRIKAWLWN